MWGKQGSFTYQSYLAVLEVFHDAFSIFFDESYMADLFESIHSGLKALWGDATFKD